MRFQKVWLILTALIGTPVAWLGLLLAIPATIDADPAALLLTVPAILVACGLHLAFQLEPGPVGSSPLWSRVVAFYVVAGAISIWASTWTASRDGATYRIFDPTTTQLVVIYFLIPIVHLLWTAAMPANGSGKRGRGGRGERRIRSAEPEASSHLRS
jgi:hypothetical protein